MRLRARVARVGAALLVATGATGQARAPEVPDVRAIGIDQRPGERLPPGLRFRDEAGRSVAIAELAGGRPVILALVYYRCPMLCTLVLNGLVSATGVLPLEAGRDFEVVAVSIDPRETPALAAEKKEAYVARDGRPGAAAGWHFLTGDADAIDALARTVGFRYQYDAATGQYAHASGITLLTPDGTVSRYLLGVEYAPRDLRLGLLEASRGKVGSVVDRFLLLCYRYDPASGRYGPWVMGIVRLGGVATVAALLGFILVARRRERARAAAAAGGA